MNGFKGTINRNGRPKGQPNKVTMEVREHFNQLINNNLEQMQNDIKELEPKDRLKILLELAKFVLPTLKATELTTGIENGFSPIVINLGNGISPDEDKTINAELEAKC